MTPLRLIPLLAAACAALLFTSVAGANTVQIATGNNKTFNPTIVNIAPGDTVEWNWVGPDTNHSPASNESVLEPFDTDPGNPNPNFNHPRGVNLSHTFQHSGSFAFHCKVHPDIMRGTVNVSGAPVPAFTSSSPAFVNEDVTFDGSTSNDPAGSIGKFEWDFGNGFTEATQTEHHTYLSPGTFTAKLRVTDDRGNVREVSHQITIATRAPSASFTAGPHPPAKTRPVALDAPASAAPAGRSIAGYSWDLDNDGVFETDGAGSPTGVTTSYPGAGTKTIGLRVTDDHGDSATTTRTVTVSNAAPSASFTASTATPAFGGTVNFDGSASSDSDGTVADFKWDLDGDGTFETDTGTTATTSHAYSSSGPVSVKLQVTDNEG